MKKMNRVLSFVIVCCMLVGLMGLSASASSVKFTDITGDQWYYTSIIRAAEKGIVAGNSDGTYAPRGQLTWAQTITFAVRLDQYKNGDRVYGSADQTGSNWYDIYVNYALERGIISAAPTAPNAAITRADAAIIFAAVLGSYSPVNYVPAGYFTDVPAGHAAYNAVYALAEAGICNGKEGRAFGVNDSFLRSEVAAIVARMADLVSKVVIQSPEAIMLFDALEGRVFKYESTSLGGITTLTMGADGNFTGRYIYTDTADSGDDYPLGTRYLCNFSGSFRNVTRLDDLTYQVEVSPIASSALPGRVVIDGGLRYISTEPYGFEEGTTFDIFLPGSYTSDMPECMINSLLITNNWGKNVPERVPETVIHNHDAHKTIVEIIHQGVSAANLFERLEGKTFTYSSGAGAWSTTITFGEYGSFTGVYHDSNMGETGKTYPGGTVYTNTFWGSFSEVVKEGNCKYSLRLRYFYLDEPVGQEYIKDGVRYKNTEAHGFEKAGYFTLYLPGMDTSKTPEPMNEWLTGLMSWGYTKPNALPFWSLYNIGGEAPFIGY